MKKLLVYFFTVALIAIASPTSADQLLGSGYRTTGGVVYFRGSPSNFVLGLPQACAGGQYSTGLSTTTGLPICAALPTGTSGATIPLNNGNNAWSGNQTHSGTEAFSGATTAPTVATGDSSTNVATTANVAAKIAAASAAIPRGYISGLTLANNATNPNTQVDTGAGMATSDDNLTVMSLAATTTKSLGAWTAGSGNGCLDTGSAAATTWYHVFVVFNPTTPATDVLCSTSATAPTLPSGYTKKRRVGAVLTTGTAGNITAFVQVGDDFQWATPIVSVNNQSISTTALTPAFAVPPGVRVRARMRGNFASANGGTSLLVYSTDETTSSIAASAPATVQIINTGTGYPWNAEVLTNTTQQVKALANAVSTYSALTVGWQDTRGK